MKNQNLESSDFTVENLEWLYKHEAKFQIRLSSTTFQDENRFAMYRDELLDHGYTPKDIAIAIDRGWLAEKRIMPDRSRTQRVVYAFLPYRTAQRNAWKRRWDQGLARLRRAKVSVFRFLERLVGF